ncbi:MAG: hypothetical protein VX899_13240 [Myxococcota bacterium]|nr:hypothetical protein [Myxococcota bacterium]
MGERRARLEALLKLEIRRVTEELEDRRDLLIMVWGEQRARAPFLDTVYTRWRTLPFSELLRLTTPQVEACSDFYRELDRLRLYLETTQDMPKALAQVYDGHLGRLQDLCEGAIASFEDSAVEWDLEAAWEE